MPCTDEFGPQREEERERIRQKLLLATRAACELAKELNKISLFTGVKAFVTAETGQWVREHFILDAERDRNAR